MLQKSPYYAPIMLRAVYALNMQVQFYSWMRN